MNVTLPFEWVAPDCPVCGGVMTLVSYHYNDMGTDTFGASCDFVCMREINPIDHGPGLETITFIRNAGIERLDHHVEYPEIYRRFG